MFGVVEREMCSTWMKGKASTALVKIWERAENSMVESYKAINITDTVESRKIEQHGWGAIGVAERGWDQVESQREDVCVDIKEHRRIHKFYTKGVIRTDKIKAHCTKVFSYPK